MRYEGQIFKGGLLERSIIRPLQGLWRAAIQLFWASFATACFCAALVLGAYLWAFWNMPDEAFHYSPTYAEYEKMLEDR